jgi:hypothetical protein
MAKLFKYFFQTVVIFTHTQTKTDVDLFLLKYIYIYIYNFDKLLVYSEAFSPDDYIDSFALLGFPSPVIGYALGKHY